MLWLRRITIDWRSFEGAGMYGTVWREERSGSTACNVPIIAYGALSEA